MSVELVAGEHDTARIRLPLAGGERIVSPQEVAAEVLKALRARAEAVLGTKVERAVVTVPAYFDDAQRQATRDAGRIAGLDVVRIVNEPTAAALAYGIGTGDRASDEPQHVAVYDLGGGTFDISILRLTPAETDADGADDASTPDYFQVLATAGDTRLGGDDVDHMLIALFTREIHELLGVERAGGEADPSSFPPETRRALKQFAEGVKHELSEREAASVKIDLGAKDGEPRVYERTITRDEFEAMIEPWARKTLDACARAVRDAKRSLGDATLDAVVLVGGSTRVPLVRRVVGEFFGIEPYTALDPDRVVAMGAAVQAGVLGGTSSGSLLLDVIPLSLGIETAGGAVAKVIMRNSPVPTRATEMFSTQVDGQVSIKLNVVQGEREMAGDCRSLGVFELSGIPPMPAGVPQVEVEFLVDDPVLLHVVAGVLDARGLHRVDLVAREPMVRHDLQLGPLARAALARRDAQHAVGVDEKFNFHLRHAGR
ncbi:MAG: Hsp70 family protein, partial [Planctomycetota bacterium]